MAGRTARRPADGSYSRAWRNVSKIVLRPGIRMMMRLDWRGQENIPADGPVILAANHLSYMDIFAVSLFADSARRYPVFLAKSSLFTIPVVGSIISRLGQLPVYRGQADAALVLKQAAELAARNNACVIFYPEATVTRDPEQWPMVAKTGVARLALEQNIPVVPIAHWGAQRILPYGTFVPKFLPRKTVRIAAGPPVDLSEFAGQPLTNAVLRPATDKIMTAVTALLGGLRSQQPPAEFYHPAVARRKLRQDLRALQEANQPDGAGPAAGQGPAAGTTAP
jgi:1-acyl-sn-glycerol-3-phosphate acyltransferase